MPEVSTGSTTGAETVAVVVVTFNRADLLCRMLAGLRALTGQPDAVIVVEPLQSAGDQAEDRDGRDHLRQPGRDAGAG